MFQPPPRVIASPTTFILTDAAAWIIGLTLASALRLETLHVAPAVYLGDAAATPALGLLLIAALCAALYLLLAWALRLHRGRHVLASFEEIIPLTGAIGVVTIAATVVISVSGPLLTRTTPLIAAPIVLVLCAAVRGVSRLITERRPERLGDSERAVILGAGDAGRQLVASMLRDPDAQWNPVAFLDDDPRKRYFRHLGVPVLGRFRDAGDVAARTDATTLVIAVPGISKESIDVVRAIARDTGLAVKIVPPLAELLAGVHFSDLREIELQDLLGRKQLDTDLSAIAQTIRGQCVLVTGAGGSIGSELCRQIAAFSPSSLVMVDRDESALHGALLTMYGTADLGRDDVELADIRDADRLRTVFERHRPALVFHAAALKHVNMLERCPSEAIKTNVIGTQNVLAAARASGVQVFVNVSTDKAADPVTILGYSKRVAERLTAATAQTTPGTWVSVRFGNVLATRGSVLHTFFSQIEAGGPVTVTDPDVTRFFMTVGEAVQLILQATVVGTSGQAMVLEMGEPVRILDVARHLIETSGRDVRIVFTGLQPGEKLHEDLFSVTEHATATAHPLVTGVDVAPLSAASLPAPGGSVIEADLARRLADLCATREAPAQIRASA